MAVTGVDIALWSISAAILIIYHLYFVIHAKKNPALFNIGVNLEARKKWLAEVMTTKGKEIVGVQTLRNGMMASSALATGKQIFVVIIGSCGYYWLIRDEISRFRGGHSSQISIPLHWNHLLSFIH